MKIKQTMTSSMEVKKENIETLADDLVKELELSNYLPNDSIREKCKVLRNKLNESKNI